MSAAAVETPESAVGAPGNWLAGEIRRFQEKSEGLFPASQPGDERTRFNTIYNIEYVPLTKDKLETPQLLKRPGVKKEAPFSLEQAKRFNTWKIRKDLVEVEKVQQRISERRRTAQLKADSSELPKIERGHTTSIVSTKEDTTPEQHRKFSIRTPILPPGVQPSATTPVMSRKSTAASSAAAAPEPVRMSAPANLDRGSKQRLEDIKEDLAAAAENYMARQPHADRRVIDKALQVSNKAFKEDPKQRATKQPVDPRREAERWLEQANEHEQELALRFFNSVSGMKLMGISGKQQQANRLHSLLNTLERGEAKLPAPSLSYEDEQRIRARKQRNLLFVKSASSDFSPEQRLQQQTWHHMPRYEKKKRHDNVRSHFTQPQKIKPLHFTIHPDWGP